VPIGWTVDRATFFLQPASKYLNPRRAAPMTRLLLALSLALFAPSAFAGEPASTDPVASDPAAKPGKSTSVTATQDADTASTTPSPAPTRSATPRTPRWHSLLPGMIR
jgi:hypothetical protein